MKAFVILLIAVLLIASPAAAQTNTFPSSGSVGIGTTSPAATLSVAKSSPDTTNGDAQILDSGLTTSGNYNFLLVGKSAASGQGGLFGYEYNSTAANATAYMGMWGATVGTQTLNINSSGNVGIGTIAPGYALDVQSTASGTTAYAFSARGAGQTSVFRLQNSNSAGWAGTDVFDDSGTLQAGYGWGNASVAGPFGNSAFMTTLFSNPLYLGTNGSIRLAVSSSGNIGIGTTSPASSLDVSQHTDAVALPSGTTAQRPGSPVNGEIRYNTSNSGLEAYVSGSWTAISGSFQGSAGQLQCSGANCSNATGSGTIQYCPNKGNIKTTASQGNYTIPSACLTATLTSMYVGGTASSSVSASSLYLGEHPKPAMHDHLKTGQR